MKIVRKSIVEPLIIKIDYMKNYSFLVLLTLLFAYGCADEVKNNNVKNNANNINVATDSVVFSFAFNGCNRVGWEVSSSDNPSMANHVALDSIFSDMQRQNPKPDLFFNLGDIVRAEQPDLQILDDQLSAWVKLPAVTNFVANSGIKMITVPGNHELLKSGKNKPEYPLAGSTAVWSKYMSPFTPATRTIAPDSLGWQNQLTYSFTKHNIAFIVMNTDTYNPPVAPATEGEEGQIPLTWIEGQLKQFKKDSTIDHIFVLGHRSYYIYGTPTTDHGGLPDGKALWDAMDAANAVAWLGAHTHDYNRYQDTAGGVTQIIAGNAGSPGDSAFFGYSQITVYSSGKIALESRGYCVEETIYKNPASHPMMTQDVSDLKWTGNTNPLTYPYTIAPCVK